MSDYQEEMAEELDEHAEDWPYCECDLEPTIEEFDWGICECCGKPLC